MEKKVTSLSEAQFLRMRPANFLGSEMPQNIFCKEAIDNCTDIVAEGKSTQSKFMILKDQRTIVQMDNGNGVSTRQCLDANGNKSTYLYNAIHKLYSGGNYGDENTDNTKSVSDIAGTNGIGYKLITCISKFSVTGISKNPSKYASKTLFIPGVPKAIIKKNSENNEVEKWVGATKTEVNSEYNKNITEFFETYPSPNEKYIGDFVITTLYGYAFSEGELITLEDADGNLVEQTPDKPRFIQMMVPKLYINNGYAEGFITISKMDDTIIPDEPDCTWLNSYASEKIKSIIPSKSDVFFSFNYYSDSQLITYNYARALDIKEFNKKYKKELSSNEIILVHSWEEDAEEILKDNNDSVFRTQFGFFDILFSKDSNLLENINCVVQGARVNNPKNISIPVEVGNQKINIILPCVWKLSVPSKRISISYTDQTKTKYASTAKTNVKMNLRSLITAALKIPEIKSYVESEANEKFLKKGKKSLASDFYWPASTSGDSKTAREYFSAPFKKNPEYAVEVINRIKDDEDVIKYAKEKGYDIDAIIKALG